MKGTTIKIFGGEKLRGEVVPIPNKNSLVAALPAAILTDKDVVYKELPDTSDITKILQILELLGATIKREGKNTIINCSTINSYEINKELGNQFRASIMFAGPLLSRFGKARIPMPGGCTLGFRSIEAHVDVFKQVGVTIEPKGDWAEFRTPEQPENQYTIWPREVSVTATENLAMYAAGTPTRITITDAACEPHVTDLLTMLTEMGAVIDGIMSNRIMITGKGTVDVKGATFKARPDFVDIAGYIVAAATTDGEIKIKGANIPDIMDGLIKWLELFGIEITREENDLVVKRAKGGLEIDHNSGFPLASPELPKLAPRPWPGFPVDVIPVIATLACKTKGRLLLQNWMYEDGLQFVRELNSLGADIFMSDPQRIIINGPIIFRGGEITPPRVIQAMKAVFLAALCEPVETVIHGVDILKRRYPNIIDVYRGLGAHIEIVK